MTNLIELSGQRFGRLRVTSIDRTENRRSYWKAVCDCGNELVVIGDNLRRGNTRSCGCLAAEETAARSLIHGDARVGRKTPEYRTWCEMLSRCNNPRHWGYADYGGKGVSVCDRWSSSFEAFLEDMGRKPTDEHSIDRYPDRAGDYAPGNCRWATAKEQTRNRSCTRMVIYRGVLMPLEDAAEASGLSVPVLAARYHRGCVGDRLFRPARRSPRSQCSR